MIDLHFENYNSAEEAPQITPPGPFVFGGENEEIDDKFEIRCVCHQPSADGSLVQCEKCFCWFHKQCIYIPRGQTGEYSRFYCPFCLQQKIRCSCKKHDKYNEQLLRCVACHFFVHRACELPEPMKMPLKFLCNICAQKEKDKDGTGDGGMVI